MTTAAPRFGGGGVKCKNCNDNVYASERIDYDGQTYHTGCFKCLNCKNVIGLSAVAMIKGDLYCKNCFLRIFAKEGKYSSFGEKTLPKGEAERGRAATVGGVAPGASAPISASAASASPAAVLTCVVADCSEARVAKKNYCLAHLNSALAEVSQSQTDLAEAIAAKNTDKVAAILAQEKSADLLFKANGKGVTPLEQAFTGIQNSRACGEIMVNWLRTHVAELEKSKQ